MAKSKRQAAKSNSWSEAEVIGFLMSIPEISEAYTQADVQLALDDRGWINPGTKLGSTEPSNEVRQLTVTLARAYWQKDPLCKQAVRLWTNYTFGGTGMTADSDDAAVAGPIKKFLTNRRNKKLLQAAGQERLSKKLLVDGEIFFAIFGKELIRTFDPMQISKLITNPDDDEEVLVYKRITADNKTLYYRDWAAPDDVKLEALVDPDTNKAIGSVEDDVVVYHLAFDQFGKRGNSLLSSAIDWTREHRRFLEARVAILQALSKYAHKATVKGGQGVLNQIQTRLQSSMVTTGTQNGLERNPPNAPGATWLQNAGIDLNPMPRVTGAGDAKTDGEGLKLMVSAATGIMLHYFGDPSTGNLATASAMELPMLKQFQGYQQLWKDAFRDMFSIVLDEAPDDDPSAIDVDLPPVIEKDLTSLGTFIGSMVAAFPEAKVPEVLMNLLQALGVDDLETVMDSIEAKRQEIDAQQKTDQAAMLAAGTVMPKDPKQAAAMKESYDALTKALSALAIKL